MKKNNTGLSKGSRTRQRVLAQAARLFATHGYDGVTMARLADMLELTKAALYTHFSGKYEIYIESVVDYLDKRTQKRPAIAPDLDPEQNLERYLDWLLKSFEQDKTYRLLLLRLFIDADAKTTRMVAERAMESPVKHLAELVHVYKPKLNALEFVYSLASIAMLNPDLHKSMAVFANGADQRDSRRLLRHMMQIVKSV